jgi:peptidoglycan/xylan/chitin deacetylase (PgdA/CDA1 family)
MRHFRIKGWKLAVGFVLFLAVAACFGAFEIGWLGSTSITVHQLEVAAICPAHPQCRIAILNSKYSSQFFHSTKTYDAHIEYWRKLVQGLQMPAEVIADSKLETGLQGFQILVMPSAVCLSDKERASLRAFLTNGGGVICTWATGARDELGAWRGLALLRELTGADSLEFTQRPPPWYVSFVSRRPTTAGAPGGFRIQVDSPDRLEAKSFSPDAYWSDSRLSPVDANLPVDFQGALVHNTVGQGRLVWLGFQENSAVAGGNDKDILDHSLTNGLVWVGQQPLCAVDRWPSAHPAAALFACDVEEDADNAAYAASGFRKAQEKGTFFCVSSLVKRNPDLVRQLLSAGEVASHGDTQERFVSNGAFSQAVRIESSKWGLWRAAGTHIEGFHPASEAFGNDTLRAMAATRVKYLLTSLESGAQIESVLPEACTVSQSLGWIHRDAEVVILTRTTEDDLHYSPLGIVGLDPSWMTQKALADFEIIHGLGGLYIFNFHSQGFSSPEFVGSLATLIDQFHRSATWIATAGVIADWWEMRSRLALAISSEPTNGIRLTIKYGGTKPLDNVTLSVYPPADSPHGRIVAVGATQATAEIAPENVDGRLTVRLGRLSPATTAQYVLTWTP